MKQESSLTKSLSDAQVSHIYSQVVQFTIHTEAKGDIAELVSRYFGGATLSYGLGLWAGRVENGVSIFIIGTLADLQRIIDLAGDIKVHNAQHSVLVTWTCISRLDV